MGGWKFHSLYDNEFWVLASQSGDDQLSVICFTLAASSCLFNFPVGKFFRDGGAYLWDFSSSAIICQKEILTFLHFLAF